MARRSNILNIAAKIADRAIRDSIRASIQAQKKQPRFENPPWRDPAWLDVAYQKQFAENEKQIAALKTQQQRFEEQTREVAERNQAIGETLQEFHIILIQGLSRPAALDFASLRFSEIFHPFEPPHELVTRKLRAKEFFFSKIKPPTFLERIFRSSRYIKEYQAAESAFQKELKIHEALESVRKTRLEESSAAYEVEKQTFLESVRQKNAYVDKLKTAYFDLVPDAIVEYNSMVLDRSDYPANFPQKFRLAYIPESKQLVIDYELPPIEVVPHVIEYRYNKSHNSIEEKKQRKPNEIKEIYQDIATAITLRTIHEIISADQNNSIKVIVFNGFIQTIDRATGKKIRPYLISVRVTKEVFSELNLSQVEKRACLRNLGAQVSPQPGEMVAIKPIIEFDMVDKRFVEQIDVLGNLDARPNLMELDPYEFENLVHNLFSKMGLETKLTRSSRDGGVDVVAFDKRPVIGGKVVVQAKRYKNTVGVSAVRDLFGTMINEGANKGILVTTSSYGPDAYEFAKDKPIELIDGGGLLYLLEQVEIKARIIFPEDTNPF